MKSLIDIILEADASEVDSALEKAESNLKALDAEGMETMLKGTKARFLIDMGDDVVLMGEGYVVEIREQRDLIDSPRTMDGSNFATHPTSISWTVELQGTDPLYYGDSSALWNDRKKASPKAEPEREPTDLDGLDFVQRLRRRTTDLDES